MGIPLSPSRQPLDDKPEQPAAGTPECPSLMAKFREAVMLRENGRDPDDYDFTRRGYALYTLAEAEDMQAMSKKVGEIIIDAANGLGKILTPSLIGPRRNRLDNLMGLLDFMSKEEERLSFSPVPRGDRYRKIAEAFLTNSDDISAQVTKRADRDDRTLQDFRDLARYLLEKGLEARNTSLKAFGVATPSST